jgi:hypothetical protein
MDTPDDLITATAARKLLSISPATMTKLLRRGVLCHYSDPLDERKKLVSRSEVLALKVPKRDA